MSDERTGRNPRRRTLLRILAVDRVLGHPNVTGRLLWDGGTYWEHYRNDPRPDDCQPTDHSIPVTPIPLMTATQHQEALARHIRRLAAGGHAGLTDEDRGTWDD